MTTTTKKPTAKKAERAPTKGRKPRAEKMPDQPEINQELVDEDAAKRDALSQQLKTIDAQFADNLPYDLTRIENEIGFLSVTATKTMFEMGKRFLLIKEHEVHGEYLNSLQRMGYQPRAVQKIMQATLKFSDAPSTALLGKSKMFELMTEDDDSIQELEKGGTVAGLSLDKIDKMSTSELRKELREAKANAEAEKENTKEQLAEKDEMINDLDAKIKRRSKATPDEIHAELMADIDSATVNLMYHIGIIQDRLIELNEAPETTEDMRHHIASQLYRVRNRAGKVISHNHLMMLESDLEDDDDIGPDGVFTWFETEPEATQANDQ